LQRKRLGIGVFAVPDCPGPIRKVRNVQRWPAAVEDGRHHHGPELSRELTMRERPRHVLEHLAPILVVAHGPIMCVVLPVWRRHALARTDWPVEDQAYALQALMTGFLETATRAPALRSVTVDSPDKVVAAP
jgi:hypothetical protein